MVAMSASTAGALKALLESGGLGVAVYRDRAVENATLPHVTVSEGIAITSEGVFSAFDDPERHVVELAQVDVWQQWRHPTSRTVLESYTLPDAVLSLLQGNRLSTAPTPVMGMVVQSMVRLLEVSTNTVHHAITVQVHRVLLRPTPLVTTGGGYADNYAGGY